jgi:hypothetical protein
MIPITELSSIIKESIISDNNFSFLSEEGRVRQFTSSYNTLSVAIKKNMVKFSQFPKNTPIFAAINEFDYEESNIEIFKLNLKEINSFTQEGGCGVIFYEKVDIENDAYLLLHCIFENTWTIYKI